MLKNISAFPLQFKSVPAMKIILILLIPLLIVFLAQCPRVTTLLSSIISSDGLDPFNLHLHESD